MSDRHCATCRCASTITGQIAALLDAPQSQMTCEEIAKAIRYRGDTRNVRQTLDRMAAEEKIVRIGKKYSAMPETIEDLRMWARERTTR